MSNRKSTQKIKKVNLLDWFLSKHSFTSATTAAVFNFLFLYLFFSGIKAPMYETVHTFSVKPIVHMTKKHSRAVASINYENPQFLQEKKMQIWLYFSKI